MTCSASRSHPSRTLLAPDNDIPVIDPQNFFGPPDGPYALVSGRQARVLVLDLGAGEEGLGDLEVRYHHGPQPLGTPVPIPAHHHRPPRRPVRLDARSRPRTMTPVLCRRTGEAAIDQ